MRFRELHIENFGIHRERPFSFAPGVQVLYGPNEAGKSTLLSLLRHLLFGFPHQTRYLECSDKRPLAARVEFDLRDGRAGSFRRQKGRPDQVTGQWADETPTLDAPALARLLDGASPALYENIFAFSSDELKAGVDSLKAASLEEAIFGGGLGGLVRYRRIEDELAKRMADRFNPDGRAVKPPINRLLGDLKAAREQFLRSQCRPQAYDELQRAHQLHADAVNRLASELEVLRREQMESQLRLEALPQFNLLQAAREERARLVVPTGVSSEVVVRFRQLAEQQAQLTVEVSSLEEALRSRPEIAPPTAAELQLLASAAEIGRLQRQLSQMTSLSEDLPLRRRELERLTDDLTAIRAEWSGGSPPDVTLTQRTTIRELTDALVPLRRRETELRTRREDLDQRLLKPRRKLEQLPVAESVSEWDELATVCRAWRDADALFGKVRDDESAAKRDETVLLQKITGIGAFDADHPPGQLPLRATIEDYRSRWQSESDDFQRCRELHSRAQAEFQQARQSLADWDRSGEGAPRAKLLQLRTHRELGWSLIRRQLAAPTDPALAQDIDEWTAGKPERLLDLYESAVAAADLLADESLVRAEWHARRDQLAEQVSRCEERSVDCAEQMSTAEQTWTEFESGWRAEWSASGLVPRKPAEMLEWIDNFEEWEQARRCRLDLQRQLTSLQSASEASMQQLRSRIPNLPDAPEPALRQVETHLDKVRKTDEERTRLSTEIDELQADSEVLQAREHEAAREMGDWRNRLRSLLREIGLPEEWQLESLGRVLESLDVGRQKRLEADRLSQEIAAAEEVQNAFSEQVQQVLQRLSDDRPVDNAVVVAEELVEELSAAQTSQQQRAAAEAESAHDRSLHQHQAESLSAIERELHDLCGQCRLDNLVALQIAVQASEQAAHWDGEVRALERDLLAKFGARWPDVEPQLTSQTESELREHTARAAADIAALENSRQQEIEQRGVLENRLRSLADETVSLTLGAKLQSLRASLEQEAHKWAPLALTRALMQRARARFEQQHQPRILQEVSRLLDRMTLGEHPGIERSLDGSGTLLVLDRQLEQRLRPDQLSTGAQAQLYLAIRLAFAADYCSHNEPLPVVMDDVLVTFDEQRARRTLEVLGEFSQHAQVLLLTCHRRIVELWQDVTPSASVIELHTGTMSDFEQDSGRTLPKKRTKRARRGRPAEPDDPVLFPAN